MKIALLLLLTASEMMLPNTMSEITITQATASDVQAIARVHHEAWHTEFSSLLAKEYVEKLTYDFLEQFWHDYFQHHQNASVFVAKKENQIVGFIALFSGNDGVGEIDKIYVDPKCQRQGIGSLLTNFAFSFLQTKGCSTVLVKVFVKNINAQKFYEAAGGVCIKEQEIPDYHGDILMKIYSFDIS